MNDLFYIDGYKLDKYQIECIKCDKNLLVVAGAGCGKTSTILGKVKYLISNGYKSSDILCISLTNEATNNLKNKLFNIGLDVDCYTFHKLGLKIIKNYYENLNIVETNYLEYIIDEYFFGIVKYSYRKYLLMLEFKTFKYDDILNSKEFLLYKKNIVTFIKLLKNKRLDIKYIFDLYRKNVIKHTYLFLMEIYRIYDNDLKSSNSIDFNDMIIIANNLVNENRLNLGYKYIIIDEFQDSSKIRLELIKSIMIYSDSKIMCVGDDYQSIYRFAGSDLQLFLSFKKIMGNSEIMYLKNTYRNSMELVFVSTKFISKNNYQLKKELVSNKRCSKPIKIYYSNNKVLGLKELLKYVSNDYMIIGRNNLDINYYVEKNKDINKLKYFTAHKSKGLESENVIIINLTDDVLGFPSKIKNNNLIEKLFDKELYKYDEERRLFYVAITRSKNNVYMLVDKSKISTFVKELIYDYIDYIEFIN